MKVSVVICAGDSFCCNYATDLCIYDNYASDNVCCIFAGFQVLLSVTGMLVDLSVAIMQLKKQLEKGGITLLTNYDIIYRPIAVFTFHWVWYAYAHNWQAKTNKQQS